MLDPDTTVLHVELRKRTLHINCMTQDDRQKIQRVLDFWFGAQDSLEYGEERMAWWVKDDAFDARVDDILRELHEQAVVGDMDHWADETWSALALVILLDQVPRNIFRNSPKSFASDAKARDVAHRVVDGGLDRAVPVVMRKFFYMPFEHSESLDEQALSVKMIDTLGSKTLSDYARQHLDIVQRFGRFPHRNAVLGRQSTAEETEFLTQPNSSF